MSTLFEIEMQRHDWSSLRQACSDQWKQDAAMLLRGLVNAQSEAAARDAYFRIEGACFPQFNLSQSCPAITSCLLAALADGTMTVEARGWALEALQNILRGEAHSREVAAGNPAVAAECRRVAGDGTWLLYRLYRECSQDEGATLERATLKKILAAADPLPERSTAVTGTADAT